MLDHDFDSDRDTDLGAISAPLGGDDDDASVELAPLKIKRRSRARTIAMRRLTKEELRIGALLYPERSYWRPQSRGECANVGRPCPYVSCKYHLYIDVARRTGSIKVNFPDREVWELEHSCALDIAEQGGITLEEVGEILNLTAERIRQVESRGLLKLKEVGGNELFDYLIAQGENADPDLEVESFGHEDSAEPARSPDATTQGSARLSLCPPLDEPPGALIVDITRAALREQLARMNQLKHTQATPGLDRHVAGDSK
jgi:hypothetical protein